MNRYSSSEYDSQDSAANPLGMAPIHAGNDSARTGDGERKMLRSKKSLAMRLEGMQSRTKGAAERWESERRKTAANTFTKSETRVSTRLWDTDKPENKKKRELKEAWGNTTGKYSERRDKSFGAWLDTAGVLEQDSRFNRRWDLLTASLLLFVAIVTPFELGFLETNINTTEGITLFAVNRFVDLVFTIDILVQMNTMYFDPRGRKVYSRKRIFAHYARTWLFVDVISILPFELILFLLNEHSVDQSQARLKAIRFIRLLRLLKLLRVLRGLRIFARWEARLTLNYALLSLQKYFLTLLIAAHWLGCTLMLTHQLLSPDCEAEDIATDRCTFLYYYLDGRMVNVSVLNKYALSIYFATGELMGTPYGDIIPVRGEERLYFIVCHLVAGFVNAYLVGGMVAAISALNARNQAFYNSMDTLNRFLKEKRLVARNPRLCERLRSYYIFKHREGGGDGWGDIVQNTSREMQGEVVQELHSDWLSRVHYFHGVDRDGIEWEVDDEFKLQLSLNMHITIVAPLEAVFKEDSPIDCLYVIQQGLVGCQSKVLRKGDPFGEDVLVYYNPEVWDEADFAATADGQPRYSRRPKSRGYRATALINTVLMVYDGEGIHELLDRPKYEFIKQEIRRKMFRWQLRHVMKTMFQTLKRAAACKTYGDGMEVLMAEYGHELLTLVPSIQYHYMRIREEGGDDEVKVMRLFRKMWNRRKFLNAVDELIRKRRRANALTTVRDELLEFLTPLGARTYANKLISNGVTVRTVREYTTLELVSSGLPVMLAKRAFKAARDLPDVDPEVIGEDGVAVDSRLLMKGHVTMNHEALDAELKNIDAEAKAKRKLMMWEEFPEDDGGEIPVNESKSGSTPGTGSATPTFSRAVLPPSGPFGLRRTSSSRSFSNMPGAMPRNMM